MIYDKARDLAKAMAESEEYVSYKNAKEKAFANDTTKALLKEYMTLYPHAGRACIAPER